MNRGTLPDERRVCAGGAWAAWPWLIVGLALSGAACTDVAATNPYDPTTPAAQQAPARIEGILELPACTGAEIFENARVELTPLNQPGRVLHQVTPEEIRPDGGCDPDAEGAQARFILSDIEAGAWLMRIVVPGFEPTDRGTEQPLSLDQGAEVEVGTILLAPAEAAAVTLVGRVERAGAGMGNHGGILVDIPGRAATTLSNADGDFELQTLPGTATLRFTAPGYAVSTLELDTIPAGGRIEVSDASAPVVLTARPGRVTGRVQLARLATVERVQRVVISASPEVGDGDQNTSPDADGAFALDDLAAGVWTLTWSAPGYQTEVQRVEVAPGATAETGQTVLAYAADGADSVRFSGRIELEGATDHGGTRVALRVAGDDLAYAETITDAEGAFEIPAAAGERYRVEASRLGYDVPDGELADAFVWSEADGAFVDDGGALDLDLVARPLEGAIRLSVNVGPGWIPEGQRNARVTVTPTVGGAGPPPVQASSGAEVAVPVQRAGQYLVTVSRPGFTEASQFVELTPEAPEINLDPIQIRLVQLASAAIDFTGSTLNACELRGPYDLRGANLSGATLIGTFGPEDEMACPTCGEACGALNLTGVDLSNADLTGADFSCGAEGCEPRVILTSADLFGVEATGVDFTGADLRSADLFGARLQGSIFMGANLRRANFSAANLSQAQFSAGEEARYSLNPCHDAQPPEAQPSVLLEGVTWAQADLSGAQLAGVDLRDALLDGTRLVGADLRRACLLRARMVLDDLSGADMRNTDARQAVMTNAILQETDLRGAQLARANLASAVIERADFSLPETCVDPYPWTALENFECAISGEGLRRRVDDPRCCRTHINRTNLNGANLIGANFNGADLDRASMLGVTLGDAPVKPEEEPSDCRLEKQSLCWTLCQAARRCNNDALNELFPDGLRPESPGAVTCRDFTEACVEDRVPSLGSPLEAEQLARCVTEVYFPGQCGDEVQPPFSPQNPFPMRDCLRIIPPSFIDAPRAPLLCDFEEIEASRCPPRPEAWNGAAAPNNLTAPSNCLVTRTRFEDARLNRASLPAVVLNHPDLRNATMRRADMRSANFFDASLEGANFSESDLSEATLRRAELTAINLTDATVTDGRLPEARLDEAILTGADFAGADLSRSSLERTFAQSSVDFSGANLEGASVKGAALPNARITAANLERADLTGAELTGLRADEDGVATLVNAQAICTEMNGGLMTGSDWSGMELAAADLTCGRFDRIVGRDLLVRGSALERSVWLEADLRGAQLGSGELAPLCREVPEPPNQAPGCAGVDPAALPRAECLADARGACAPHVGTCNDLEGAWFIDSDFRGASLYGSRLVNVQMPNARLDDADLTRVDLTGANLAGADMTRVQGDRMLMLNTCVAGTRIEGVDAVSINMGGATSDADAAACRVACQTSPPDALPACAEATANQPERDPFLRVPCPADEPLVVTESNLGNLRWANADLQGSQWEDTVLNSQAFGGVADAPNLDGSRFSNTTIDGVGFRRMTLNNVTFSNVTLVARGVINDVTFNDSTLHMGTAEPFGRIDIDQTSFHGRETTFNLLQGDWNFINTDFRGVCNLQGILNAPARPGLDIEVQNAVVCLDFITTCSDGQRYSPADLASLNVVRCAGYAPCRDEDCGRVVADR